jgi:Tfp pilus assembly protein PilF
MATNTAATGTERRTMNGPDDLCDPGKPQTPAGQNPHLHCRIPRRLATRVLPLLACLTAPILASPQQPAPADPAAMRQLRQAVSLAEHNDPNASMVIVNRLLEQNPRFAPALKLKGMLFEEAGRTSEATALYEQALQYAPNDPDLLLKTGIHQLVAGNPEKAVILLAHCVRIAPSDGDAEYYLAQAYHLDGQTELALRAIRESARLEPDNAAVLQKYGEYLSSAAKYQEALDWLTKAQRADATLPHIDYDMGVASYKLMDLSAAGKSLARAVQAQPTDLSALQLLATVQTHLADWAGARDSFTRVLAIKPDDVDSRLGLGQCEVELKDYPAALQALHAVLHADPTRLQAHFYLSRAYAALGQTEDAQHEAALHQLMMQQITFVQSEANEAHESVIADQARALLTQHKEAEALQLYQNHFKGTSAQPADAWVFVGKLYLYLGDRTNGLRCLHHALEIDPRVRGAYTYQGILALKDGDLSAAEADFQAELAHDPNYQMAIAEMGEVRYRQQRWPDAARLLAQSKTMTPQLLYMLCDADFHLNDAANADLAAEVTEAYGRSNSALMTDLIALLRANNQQQLADRLSADLSP